MPLIICIRLPGTRDIRYFQTKTIFYFHIVNYFRNKIISAQRNVHIIKILSRYHQKKDFLGWIFCLCIENVMYMLDLFFPDEVMVLEDSSHTLDSTAPIHS